MSPIDRANHRVANSSSDTVTTLLAQIREGNPSNAQLLKLFAAIAEDVGRGDLLEELNRHAETKTVASQPSATASQYTDPTTMSNTERGLRFLREGRLSDAEAAFREVLRIAPTYAPAVGNLGVALAQMKRIADAEAAFLMAARLEPGNPTWCSNLATACLDRGMPLEAERWARQALILDPRSAESYRRLGAALERQKQYDGAIAAYESAIRIVPGLWEAHAQLGRSFMLAGRHNDAESPFREATRLRADHVPAWLGLGAVLQKQEKHQEAERCFRKAVELDPRSADARLGLGSVLDLLDRPNEAENEYRELIRLTPNSVPANSNLGNILRVLGHMAEAERYLREAIRLRPKSPEGHLNLGAALIQMGRMDDAIACYDEAIRLRSDYPQARVNRSLAYLSMGDYDRGCTEYEWRWKLPGMSLPTCGAALWDGSPLNGKSILLLAEQGLGDTLQFVRYAAAVKARGAGEVIVTAPQSIVPLIATCLGVDRVVLRGGPLPSVDTYIPLMSLLGILGVPKNESGNEIPYLTPSSDRVSYWLNELEQHEGFKLGIAWQGSKSHKGDRQRSVSLERFAPLFAIPGITILSLQKGVGSEQLAHARSNEMNIIDLGARTESGMEDVAGVIANLDLLVTVDTALAHLAGAMGCPIWVALPFAADWRWLRQGETTAWYPTMRLFRQQSPGDWDGVFRRLGMALAGHVRGKQTR